MRGLATQTAIEVDIGLGLQRTGIEAARGIQRPCQITRHFSQPITRVEGAELQHGLPVDAVGKTDLDHPFGAALASHQLQLRQADLAEIATDRTAQAEVPCRPLKLRSEVTQVIAFAIADFCLQLLQRHGWRLVQRVQTLPGEIQPIELGIGLKRLAPGERTAELQMLLIPGLDAQQFDIRARGIDPAAQGQRHRRLLGGQSGAAVDSIAAAQVTLCRQRQRLQVQRLRQGAAGLKILAGEAQFGGQVLGQRLHLSFETGVEITAAVSLDVQAALQFATYLQRHLPGLAIDLRQLQATTQGQGPIALWCQLTTEVQAQVITLQGQALQLHALLVPTGDQFEIAQLRLAVQTQLTQLDIAQLQAQWQVEVRQAQRLIAGLPTFGQSHGHLLQMQAIQA